MPLKIIREDITRMKCGAIVNPTNPQLIPDGGTDAAIHRAAGPKLAEACRRIGHLAPGHAALTGSYQLPCRHVIHTVGPVWKDGNSGEAEILRSCYREALLLAKRRRISSVAFPLIAAGSFGFPRELALSIATEEIREFLKTNEMDVWLVVFDPETFRISQERFADIQSFIDQNYFETFAFPRQQAARRYEAEEESCSESSVFPDFAAPPVHKMRSASRRRVFSGLNLQERIAELDESFSEMLLRKIDESAMTDVQCYKKANIDRKLFSKIRSDSHYKPSKPTVLAFAIALELPLEDAKELLEKAGFALSHSSKFDVIVEYFIQNGIYDLFEINEALFAFDQTLLG